MFEIMTKHFWIVVIIVTCANAVSFKFRSQEYIKENPDLAAGYSKLLKGYLIYLNIPWIVMGLGCTIGGVPTAFHYFNPQDGNPYVLAWFGSVFLLWILGSYWIFLKGGAETLVPYSPTSHHFAFLNEQPLTNCSAAGLTTNHTKYTKRFT